MLTALAGGSAAAQDNTAVVVPPAPAIVAPPAPLIMPAPVGQGPAPHMPAATAAPAQSQTVAPLMPAQPALSNNNADSGQPAGAPPPAATWVPGGTARLGVLNKIDGSVSEINISVGGQVHIGDLQLSVLACMVRPPGQIPDSAVFIAAQSVSDSSAPPLYRGWILRSAPGAAIVGDASETFRVIDCT